MKTIESVSDGSIYSDMASSHPALAAGYVKCEMCGRELAVDSAERLRTGWPKCCGYTMALQSAPKGAK